MTFRVIKTKGHPLGTEPRSSNIYMNVMCSVCEKYLEDDIKAIESVGDIHKISIICEECAYGIHCAYEGGM